jgi:hypothetical protein
LFVRVFDDPQTILVDALHRAIRENTFLASISVQALDRSIREVDLFGAIREMLLDLLVLKLKNLQAICKRCLSGPCFSKEVNCFAICEGLFDVLVCEPHDLVAVRPNLSFHAIREYNLLLAV